MKILLVCPYFFEPHRWMISAYKTACYLSKKNPIVVLTTGQKPYEKINPRLKIYRLKDWFMPDPVNYSIIPGLFKKFFWLIKTQQPEIVLVNKYMFYSSLVVLAARLKKIKIPIVVATDTFPGLNWHPRSRLLDLIMKIYNLILGIPILKLADKVVLFHSGNIAIAQKLRLNFKVIPNGVDLSKINKAVAPADLKKKKEEIWVGYVGRLESVKGWYDLAQVAQKLVRKNPRLRFLFVGDKTGKKAQIEKFSHPRIQFLGFRKDALGIYQKLDIFVLPSYAEGLPNALMEAMASGLACLASQVGGVEDLIKPGYNGLVMPAGNQRQLVQKLSSLIDNPSLRKKLAQKAPQTIRQKFAWSQIARNYQKLFSQLTR